MGSASATCDECGGGDREFSTTSYLRLGGTLSDRVLIGGDFNLWWKQQEGVTLNLYNATATLTFYPQASSGFFLKGGVGAGFIDTEFREGSSTITVSLGTGLGVLAGAGYDLRLWKNVSFTPAVNFWAGWSGDVSFLGTTESNNWKHNVVDLSIGITLH